MLDPDAITYCSAQTVPRIARPQPARIVAVAGLLGSVLDDMTARPVASLSDAEAQLWGLLVGYRDDLRRIEDTARAEMGEAAVKMLRTGAV